jgi:PAS domain S-box-containing protein
MGRLHATTTGAGVKELKARNLYLRKAHNYFLTPLKNEAGQVTRVLHVVQDVSRELDLQQQLAERLAFIERLVEASVDRIVVLDRHMNYLYWNKKAEDYYAISKSKVIGRNILEVFPSLRNDPSYGEFRKVLKGETVYLPPLLTDESTEYFETYLTPVKDERDEVTAILWIVHDLTNELQIRQEKQRAQQQLEAEHRRLKEAQAIGHVGSFEWTAETNTTYWSDELYRIHGLAPQSEKITFERVISFIHPDDVEYTIGVIQKARTKAGTFTLTHRIIRADGEVRTIKRQLQSFVDEDGNVSHLSGTLQDITEQRRAEEEVKEKAYFLQRILETSPDMVSIIDLATRKTNYLNEEAFAANGFSAEDMSTKSHEELIEIIHPDDRQALTDYFQKLATATDEETITDEYRAKTKQGEWGWFFVRGKVFQRNAAGQTTQVLNVIENTTKRKKAEQEILWLKDAIAQKATDKYLTLFNSIDEAVGWFQMITDESGKPVDFQVLEVNPAYSNMSGGLIAEDSVGKRAKELVPNLEQWWIDTVAKVAFGGESIRMEQEVKDLNSWFQVYVSPVGDKKDGQFVAVYSDITKRKQQEDRQAYLLKLGDATRSLFHPNEILDEALKTVAEYLNLDRIGYNEIDPAVTEYWYRGCYAREGFAPVLGRFPMGPFQKTVKNLQKGITFIANDAYADSFSKAEKEVHRSINVGAYVTVPLVKNGRWVCNLVAQYRVPRNWTEHEIAVLEETAERIWAAVERAKAEEAIAADLRDTQILQTLSEGLVSEENVDVIYQQVMDAAIALTNAAAGTVQILDEETAELVLLATNGFPDNMVNHFNRVSAASNTSCGLALVNRQRTFIDFDVPEEEDPDGSLRLHVKAGYFSAQSTPLISRSGKTIGMVSTHWREPHHRPTERELRFLDLLSRQASDLIEHRQVEKAVRRSEEQLRRFNALLEQQVTERTAALSQNAAELKMNLAILQHAEELAQMGSWEYHIAAGQFSWSEGMYNLFGLKPGTPVRPETYFDFATEEDRSIAKRIVKNLKKAHQSFEETMRIRKNGSQRLLKIKGSVVSNEKGEAQRVVGVDLDITDISEAEERAKVSQHWLQQTAQASPDAITIYDLQKKHPTYLNNCLAHWLGTTTEDLVNRGIDGRLQLIHSDDRLRLLHFNEKLKAATDGQVLTLEYRLRKKDDSLLWIRNRSKIFQRDEKGVVTHLLSVLQDVTEEKTAERVLKNLNASLEKKNQELESKNEEITSFAFVASHDLKEPLRKIHTFSDWVLNRETALSEDGRMSLEKMIASVKRLDQLIDDILALTKVHVDNERTKKVNLNHLLQQLQEDMKERLQLSGAVIETGHLPTITGAENQLFYLFKNLISNGIKFQPKQNKPVVSLQSMRENEYIKIIVADNGIGISPEHHKKIFEMFRRLHGRLEYEGTGMGLAICRRVMDKHGGKITVESNEGGGARFICWFPAALSTS